jgi:hypothetical protein
MQDIEKARVSLTGKKRLIPFTPAQACEEMGLNWLTAKRLFVHGYLSFNPEMVEDLDESQEAELIFLGSLVLAGCNNEMLENMLENLPRPYNYTLGLIYYDWLYFHPRWRLLPNPQEEVENNFPKWLEELVENGEKEKLRGIEIAVSNAIEKRFIEISDKSHSDYWKLIKFGETERIWFDYWRFLSNLGLIGLLNFSFSLIYQTQRKDDTCNIPLRFPSQRKDNVFLEFKHDNERKVVTLKQIEKVRWDTSESLELIFDDEGIFVFGKRYVEPPGEEEGIKFFDEFLKALNEWIALSRLDKPTSITLNSDKGVTVLKAQPKKVLWVPKWLENNREARLGLGVLVEPGQETPNGLEWRNLWEERVRKQWELEEANGDDPASLDVVLTWQELDAVYPPVVRNPEDLLDLLDNRAAGAVWPLLIRALNKDKEAQAQLVEMFPQEDPASPEEQLAELREANLNDLVGSVAEPSPKARVNQGL